MKTSQGPLNPGGAIIPFFQRYPWDHRIRYEIAAKQLGPGIAVDFGCGYGFGTHLIAQRHSRGTLGLDVDSRAIRYAREHYRLPNLEFRLLRKTDIPVPASSVGTITAFEVVEHLRSDQSSRFFTEVERTLLPGGMLIGSTPNAEVLHHRDLVYHIHEFSCSELESIGVGHGFEVQILGRGCLPSSDSGLIETITGIIPPSLRRAYVLKVIQSLLFAIRKRDRGIYETPGHLPLNQSPELYFFMRKETRNA